jgi:hypothetical protein
VLEHLSDLRGAFDEMSRVLRNGGEMLLCSGRLVLRLWASHLRGSGDALLNFSLWQMPPSSSVVQPSGNSRPLS